MKKYSKPSISVKYYCTENFCSSVSSCNYAYCLVGGQNAYSNSVTFYKYTDSNGDIYYVWYYDYKEDDEVNDNYVSLLESALDALKDSNGYIGSNYVNTADMHCWHITNNNVISSVYASA